MQQQRADQPGDGRMVVGDPNDFAASFHLAVEAFPSVRAMRVVAQACRMVGRLSAVLWSHPSTILNCYPGAAALDEHEHCVVADMGRHDDRYAALLVPVHAMIAQYLALAVILAVPLNHRDRWIRTSGTLLAAIALAMMLVSIVLADFDATVAAVPMTASLFEPAKPIVLDIQAIVSSLGIGFLLWAAWRQSRCRLVAEVPLRNTASRFGLVSREAHWAVATLILALVPMGIFMSVLPETSEDRAMFVFMHQIVGIAVLVLVAARLAWLVVSRPSSLAVSVQPWERRLAAPTHAGLYGLILPCRSPAFCSTGRTGI